MAWRETRGGRAPLRGACSPASRSAWPRSSRSARFAANLERTLAREAKALLGGDVELRSARALPTRGATPPSTGSRAEGARSLRVRELVGDGARAGARRAALLVELKAVERALSALRPASRPRRRRRWPRCSRATAARSCEATLLERLGVAVGDPARARRGALHVRGVRRDASPIARRAWSRLGPRVLVAARAARADTGSCTSAAACATAAARPARRPRWRRAQPRSDAGADDRRSRRCASRRSTRRSPGCAGSSRSSRPTSASSAWRACSSAASAWRPRVSTFLRRQLADDRDPEVSRGGARAMLVATYVIQTQAARAGRRPASAPPLGVAVQPLLVRALAGLAAVRARGRGTPAPRWRAASPWGCSSRCSARCGRCCAVRAVPPSLVLRRDVDDRASARGAAWRSRRCPIARRVWPRSRSGRRARSGRGGIFARCRAGRARSSSRRARRAAWCGSRGGCRARGGLAWRQGLAGLQRPGGHAVQASSSRWASASCCSSPSRCSRRAWADRSTTSSAARRRRSSSSTSSRTSASRSRGSSATRAGSRRVLTPVVRARLAAIDGTPVTRELVDRRRRAAPEESWYLTREYVLTWAAAPPAQRDHARALVDRRRGRGARRASRVEDEAAQTPRRRCRRHGSTFDVQGVPIEAEVMSLREVDWQSLTTNFFVIALAGRARRRAGDYVATARVPADARDRDCRIAVVAAFPNVTAIPVRDVLERVDGVLGADRVRRARSWRSSASAAGLVVMVGALAATRYQRLYESVILKTLGATRGPVARAFAVEYACLGAAAGVGGTRAGRGAGLDRSPIRARYPVDPRARDPDPRRGPHDARRARDRLARDGPPARPEAAVGAPPGMSAAW